jgi:cysteine desulfurase / selenocysteine lyase
MLNVRKIREDFPILKRTVKGMPLVYLDNAATSQKPKQVIEAIADYYMNHNANIHRGVHTISGEATAMYEGARKKTANFVNAEKEGLIFVKNTSEAVNLVSHSYQLKKGDEILSTVMEHHSNIVPWQFLREKGVILKYIDINDDGTLKMEDYDTLLSKNTKLVAVSHVSNVLGTINPVKEITKIAHENGSLVLVDGAQSVPNMPVNVKDIDADFFVFSGHKMLGPTGIGCLYGKPDLMEEMPPFMGGGDMIKEVHLDNTKFNDIPWKFEAGTPNIAGVIGLGAAIDYLSGIGMDKILNHEKKITKYAMEKLSSIDKLTIFGPDAEKRGGVISFNVGDIHAHDLSSIADEHGIAIRSGHHCAQPLMERLGITAASRASFYLYNTEEEIDLLVKSIEEAKRVFRL